MADRIHVVSAAIVRTDGDSPRILLAQRAPDTSFQLAWCTAGGKVEPGERPPEALRRELREELGIGLIPGFEPAKLYEADLDPPLVSRALHVTCFRVWWAYVIGTPRAGDKTAGIGWFGVGELWALPLAPADAAGRRCLLRALGGESLSSDDARPKSGPPAIMDGLTDEEREKLRALQRSLWGEDKGR